VNKIGADAYEGPGLTVQWVEVEGPLHESWPPESHHRIFGALTQKPAPIYNQSKRVEVVSDQPLVDAERILRNFTRRAFRRAVTDDDVQPFVHVVETRLVEKYSFEQAMRAALKGVLMSPEFLFLREQPGQLSDFALASRLSYFLWSTMPDDELFELANKGQLRANLAAQVQRMVKDAKSSALMKNFGGQWLTLRKLENVDPDGKLFPKFDDDLRAAMREETELFFEAIVREDRSILDAVHDYAANGQGRLNSILAGD
jgi:hypothetical protein